MVESLRCWIETSQIARRVQNRWELTDIGAFLFGDNGRDKYLEEPTTAWLLHWLISTNREAPLAAWELLVSGFPLPELIPSQIIATLSEMSHLNAKPSSEATLRQHWEVFLHTYLEPKGRNDEALDSALSPLRLILQAGERPSASGRWETTYSFDNGAKPGIPQELFGYCLFDWWEATSPEELTLPVRAVMSSRGSPGRVFKMREEEVVTRLEQLGQMNNPAITLVESATLRQVRRQESVLLQTYLDLAYEEPTFLSL